MGVLGVGGVSGASSKDVEMTRRSARRDGARAASGAAGAGAEAAVVAAATAGGVEALAGASPCAWSSLLIVSKHCEHTRSAFCMSRPGITTFCDEHAPHTTLPQLRQWCCFKS